MFAGISPVQDPVLIFALLMVIALLAPLFSERMKVPGIIGLILCGIFLGPHALGILDRGFEIQLLGTVGLLYIMFLAGLELDRVQFMRHREHTIVFGTLTFSIPLVLGSLMGRYVLGFSWKASVLLASMFSSHTLMTYPITSRLGLTRQKAVTTTIGGTIITDTAALLVLAVIAALHTGEADILFWPRLVFFMALYVVGTILIMPRLAKWFFRNIATDGVVSYTGVLASVFICAYLAYLAGLEPIIGAFFAGLILNSLIPEKSALMNRIQFVGHSLFIPFFLISVGMLVNIQMMFSDRKTLIVAATMAFAGISTKWLAAYATRKILGYTKDEGNLIYGLSVNQAAATLAAVLVGYNIGIFTEAVLTGTIIMILFTTLAGSWITDHYARKVAITEEEEPYQLSETPHRILIPVSNPETFEEIMNLAMLIRRSSSHEPLYPLKVVQSGDNIDERVAEAEKLLGRGVVQALEADIPVTPIARVAIDNAEGILQSAMELRISTVVTGWLGDPAPSPYIFGKTLDTLLDRTSQMVFISSCPLPVNTMRRIILAVPPLIDHQPGFGTAIHAVKTLSHQLDASVHTISVQPTLEKVRETINETSPKLKETFTELDTWTELIPWLDNSLRDDDMLIFVSVRKGRLAWQPNLNRLPKAISGKFPDTNHIVVYPPEQPWGEGSSSGGTEKFHPSFLPAEHIIPDIAERSLPSAILKIIEPAFPGHEKVSEIMSRKLAKMADEEPMELLPGIILLHAHMAELKTSTAFVGINIRGWEVPLATENVQAVIILLSSKDASPEIHLKALADLVRPISHLRSAQELTSMKTPEEILKLFAPSP